LPVVVLFSCLEEVFVGREFLGEVFEHFCFIRVDVKEFGVTGLLFESVALLNQLWNKLFKFLLELFLLLLLG